MISISNLSLYFGGQDVFDKIFLTVNKGDKIGKLSVYINDELKEEANIIAKESVKRANIFSRLF